MKRLDRQAAGKVFAKWWDEMEREWFKVEILQDYSGEDMGPSLQKWLEGHKTESIELMTTDTDPEFSSDCLEKVAQGVVLNRFHVVERPLTAYLTWEIEYYKHVSIPKRQEKVHLVEKSDVMDLKLPAGDFMIFDGRRVVVNDYDKDGRMFAQTFYEQTAEIQPFLELRQQIITVAKPVSSN